MKYLLLVIAVIVIPGQALADKSFSAEYESIIELDDSFQNNALILRHDVRADSGALGNYIYARVGENWSEAHTGLTINIQKTKTAPRYTFGAGIGLEQEDERNPFRMAAFFEVDAEKFKGYLRWELGIDHRGKPEDHYYDFLASYYPARQFGIGLMARRYAGVGPRADFDLFGKTLGLWVAGLYETEAKDGRGMLGIKVGY